MKNTLTELNTINGMPVHFNVDAKPFESMVKDILDDIITMDEKESIKYGYLTVWCDWNSLNDTDYEECDRSATYECIYGIVSFKVYVNRDKDWYLDDWYIDESSITLDCETMLKLANVID